MKFLAYKLYFKAPLHISDIRADYSQSGRSIHSDTLYAAVTYAWALLGKSEWITPEPPYTVSSLFPFHTTPYKTIFFFPKPFRLPIQSASPPQDRNIAKKLKKIQFLDQHYFERLLEGTYNPDPAHLHQEYLTVEEELPVVRSQIMQRIQAHRISKERELRFFHTERLHFGEGSGLWFLFAYDDETTRQRFETALRLLGDEGLGTDRSVGNGTFSFQTENFTLRLPPSADYCMNLSLFCPSSFQELKNHLSHNETEIDANVGYDLIKRGGWISQPYNAHRKKFLWMFQEGSVLRKIDKTEGILVKGASYDVTPDALKNEPQPIYRSGKAIFVPIKF